MKCMEDCVHGNVSPSGTLYCSSSACPVQLGSTGMVSLEYISISKLKNCKAYKKNNFVKNQEDSFTYNFFK